MTPLTELFARGGPVMFVIAGMSLLAWYLTLRTWMTAGSLRSSVLRMNAKVLSVPDGRLPSPGPGVYESICFVMECRAMRLRRSLWLIAALAAILPLLGLLGTVLGMLISFEVIQFHGTSQPRLLARGIGQALMTTQAGLWTAVPVLFFHHVIRGRVRVIDNEVEVLSHAVQTAAPEGCELAATVMDNGNGGDTLRGL